MDIDEELKRLIKSNNEQQYNRGYLQGLWDFYRLLKTTHKTPHEILQELNKER